MSSNELVHFPIKRIFVLTKSMKKGGKEGRKNRDDMEVVRKTSTKMTMTQMKLNPSNFEVMHSQNCCACF